jgi:hypothetical protein
MNFLKMRTQTALKKNKAVRTNIPYRKAATVGIIFTVEDKQKHEDIKDFIARLEHDGKKVKVLEFLPEKQTNHEFRFDFFTVKDLSFWGNIQAENALKFADTAFDFLYYVDHQSNPLVLHLLARSKALCRVGRFNEMEQDYFELMIEQNGTNRGLIDTMYNYTSQLR